ncbi:MAG TPA: DUF499 domain-containing protein [Candidatus Wallbacteria bacterium]|nr:DUF499 domain-containing protein [Candidatus Wallbacteria bacterium]
MLKTLYELCKPRESVFDVNKRDDVLDLTALVENKIKPEEFFDENYLTAGMKVLFETAFKRFRGQSETGVIKLTQSMGGGKTHNMLSLGLLAKHPEFRTKVIGQHFKNDTLGKINVIAFTGRESDAPYGIWGAIAEQIGKKEQLNSYYSPLAAPGQTAWINLLKGQPLLILLDELPPYLENAKAKQIGNTDLSVVTTTALANLFTALGKPELSNVCLVISDLRATYESGSELLQSSFRELENEVNRSALNIEPVGSSSDEIYHILKKRLFKSLPNDADVNEVANAYKKSVSDARQSGHTNISPDTVFVGIKDSYPFHPSLKDLYARFKENPGFQQTRGLIRFMRIIVSQLYGGDKPKAKNKYLINSFDMDLNDRDMLTAVTQIKQTLTNAISHDIAANGKAISEEIDKTYGWEIASQISKLILVSSLADVPNALLGLPMHEIIGYLCEPEKDINHAKKALDELSMRAWYLHADAQGKYFFQNIKNLIAELNSLVDSYTNENAKKELKTLLEEKFKPVVGDCYQKAEVFPALDEIKLSEDKVSLILFEPYPIGGLHPDLFEFYKNTKYKNRVAFLSGSKNTMDNLYRSAKEYKAIQSIINRMREDAVPESNQQFQRAMEKLHKITLNVLQSARETFVTLHYPLRDSLKTADFLMEFSGNNFNGEEQIKRVLQSKQKFADSAEASGDTFRKKCEERLFTQKEMRWNDICERAATNISWQWHITNALEKLRDDCLKKGLWREHGGYIEKPPFPKEKTDVMIQEISRDDNTGEALLKIIPKYGDRVFYEIGGPATTGSNAVENFDGFKTKELHLSFICIDSKGEYETGAQKEWKNRISLKHRVFTKNNGRALELKAVPQSNAIKVKYSTDGSNPKEHGGIYEEPIMIPAESVFVLAVAEHGGNYYDAVTINVGGGGGTDPQGPEIDPKKPLKLRKSYKTNDTEETYRELAILKKHNAEISDINLTLFKIDETNNQKGWVDVTTDSETFINSEKLEKEIESIRKNIISEGKLNINLKYKFTKFETGQKFLDWVCEKKLEISTFSDQEVTQNG